jgi:hypothetical protein
MHNSLSDETQLKKTNRLLVLRDAKQENKFCKKQRCHKILVDCVSVALQTSETHRQHMNKMLSFYDEHNCQHCCGLLNIRLATGESVICTE